MDQLDHEALVHHLGQRDSEEVGWADLLHRQCVLVLGEAQSGKSTELKAKADELSATHDAWFIEVAELAKGPLHLEGADLDRWKQATTPGWFFLDSVDEADLQNLRLRDALAHLRNTLGEAWRRARVVVSCRGTDWNPKVQTKVLKEFFPDIQSDRQDPQRDESAENADDVAPEGTSASVSADPHATAITVVHLAPLGGEQVARLATVKLGAEDAAEFVDGLFATDLRQLATRPGDVLWFVDYWRDKGQFGELHQILESTVTERLRDHSEPREKQARTTPEQLLRAAERAAAATYLGANTAIRLLSAAESGLDAGVLFSDLQPTQVRELLGRAVFDQPTYGRVRFHHRAVREFLAGRWLARMLEEGHPVDEVLALLYAEIGPIQVPMASRGPLTAWLAGWNDDVRDVAVKSSPLQLMLYGDPTLLPLESRREVLRQAVLVERDKHSWRQAPDENALARFADPDLEPKVVELLSSRPRGAVPRELIDLVRIGEYRAGFKVVLARASDPREDVTTRVFSVRALAALTQDADEARQVLSQLLDAQVMEPHVLASTIEEFFPAHLGHEAVLAALLGLSPQERRVAGPAWQVARHLKTHGTRNGVRGIVASMAAELNGNEAHAWLWSCLADLAAHLIESGPEESDWEWLGPVFDLFRSQDHHWDRDMDIRSFREALRGSRPARRYLFWRQIDRLRSSPDTAELTRRYEIPYSTLRGIEPASDDIEWLLDDAQTRAAIKDRLLALDIAMHSGLVADEASVEGARESLKDHPELLKRIDRWMENRTNQPVDARTRRMAREQEARERRKKEISTQNKAHFLEHLDELRNGKFSMLWWMYEKAEDPEGRSRWGKSNLEPIRTEFGDDVLAATEEGFLAHWRTYSPLLPHERKDRNRPEYGLIVGLSGLAILHNDGFDWSELSAEEATIAARYASGEMNGFPTWFDDLIAAWPREVAQVLEQGLRADYETPLDEPVPHDVLAKASWASVAVQKVVASILIDLVGCRPPHSEVLSQALGVITDAGEPWVGQLRGVVGAKITSASADDLSVWWPILFRLDPAEATRFLERLVGRKRWSAKLQALVSGLVVSALPHAADADAASLATLCRLAYRSIRPEDDIDHPSGVTYSSGPRDYAQHARSSLVRQLEEMPGSSAFLERLANDPSATLHRDWLRSAALRRLSRDAEPEPLTERQVFELENRFSAAPTTPRQLYDVALARLANIRRDIERGTFSMRALFWPTRVADGKRRSVHEAELQKWLAHELRLRSRGHYRVAREPEEDDMNRPDIRLYAPPAGPVSIELKWADNWTAGQLEEAVTDQLIGKYMGDRDARYGILVLARTEKSGWRPPAGNNLNLRRLEVHLQKLADETVLTNELDGVKVVAIDVAPPPGSTAEERRNVSSHWPSSPNLGEQVTFAAEVESHVASRPTMVRSSRPRTALGALASRVRQARGLQPEHARLVALESSPPEARVRPGSPPCRGRSRRG